MYFSHNLHYAGVYNLQHYETALFRQQTDALCAFLLLRFTAAKPKTLFHYMTGK